MSTQTEEQKKSIFRSQFVPTRLDVQTQQDEVAKQHSAKGPSNMYANMIKIEPGVTYLRIYPPHPGGGGTYSEVMKQVYLPLMREERDQQGKVVMDIRSGKPVLKEGYKSVFDSRLHGSTEKDIIDQYCRFGEMMAKELLPGDTDGQKEYMKAIIGTGYSQVPDPKAEKGIQYQISYVLYADQLIMTNQGLTRKFGRLQYKNAVRKRLNEMSTVESSGQTISTDPFSDLDEGRAVCITFTKNVPAADMYKVDFYAPMIPNSKGQVMLFPIDDLLLDEYVKVKPLHELYVNSYKRSDFETALEALQYFDNKHGYKFFEEPAFLEILEEIDAYYPMENPAENNISARSAKSDVDLPFGNTQGVTPAVIPAATVVTPQPAQTVIAPAVVQTPAAQELVATAPNVDPFLTDLHAIDQTVQPVTLQASPAVAASDRLAAMRAKFGPK